MAIALLPFDGTMPLDARVEGAPDAYLRLARAGFGQP